MDNVERAAARVDWRLSYEPTPEPRRVHERGLDGPDLKNAYYGRKTSKPETSEWGSGKWDDPDHPPVDAPEEDHIRRWFVSAVRESIHEALEWFWVDDDLYLNPHGEHQMVVHILSNNFANELANLVGKGKPPVTQEWAV